MVKILLEGVQLCVRRGQTIGDKFKTNLGVPQGDCLSPVLFILYLSKAFDYHPELEDHNYNTKPPEKPTGNTQDLDHNYSQISKGNLKAKIDAQYADDTQHAIVGDKIYIEEIRERNLPKLQARNLQNNATKDENYTIERGSKDERWKKCKILGSYLDTNEDIKRRKQLTLNAMKNYQEIWRSKKINRNLKLRIFNSVITSIFLYNSELWTTTEAINKQLDSFQRRLLRSVINIKYPKKIKNIDLRQITKHTDWSLQVQERRLRWCGHLLRMAENTPAKIALAEAEKEAKHPRGRPKTTWLSVIKNDLKKINLRWEEAKTLAWDRDGWRSLKGEIVRRCRTPAKEDE